MVHHCTRLNIIYTFVPPLGQKQGIKPPTGNLVAYYFNFNNMDLKMK